MYQLYVDFVFLLNQTVLIRSLYNSQFTRYSDFIIKILSMMWSLQAYSKFFKKKERKIETLRDWIIPGASMTFPAVGNH